MFSINVLDPFLIFDFEKIVINYFYTCNIKTIFIVITKNLKKEFKIQEKWYYIFKKRKRKMVLKASADS